MWTTKSVVLVAADSHLGTGDDLMLNHCWRQQSGTWLWQYSQGSVTQYYYQKTRNFSYHFNYFALSNFLLLAIESMWPIYQNTVSTILSVTSRDCVNQTGLLVYPQVPRVSAHQKPRKRNWWILLPVHVSRNIKVVKEVNLWIAQLRKIKSSTFHFNSFILNFLS